MTEIRHPIFGVTALFVDRRLFPFLRDVSKHYAGAYRHERKRAELRKKRNRAKKSVRK